jgi:hypothetical protein
MGWALLIALTALAALNALAVALRSGVVGRAERGVVAWVAFFGIVSAPVLLLGYANVLTKASLAGAALALNLVLFFALSQPRLRACGDLAKALLDLPFEAMRETARAKSVVFLGVVCATVLLALAFVETVFVPNATWDGFLYHEVIVGYAIQNHGFATIPLPMHQAVQAANGYPHLCEAMTIWFVIFTDKTLVELPNDLAAPAMMLAAYVLVRPFGDRRTAIAWACVLVLVPQAWAQLCQTYIDVEVAFFAIAAIAFAIKRDATLRDGWIVTLALLLLLGSKSSSLTTVPPIALISWGRLLARHRTKAIATVGASALALAAFGALVPLRNWSAFHDPLWPITFDSELLGIHWKGLIGLREMASANASFDLAWQVPTGGPGDVTDRGYGYACAWVLFPLAGLALLASLWASLRDRGRNETTFLSLAILGCALATPTLNGHNARYNLHIIAALMALVTWLLSSSRWARAREGVSSSAIVLAMIPLAWMRGPGWYWVSTKHPEDVLAHPLESRVVLERPEFDMLGAQRERELHENDTVAFEDGCDFVGALWNFHYSNRVVYVPYENHTKFVASIARENATWVVTATGGAPRSALEGTGRWEFVGEVAPTICAVFRKKSR